MDTLTEAKGPAYPLCMKGKVRTKERCPKCGKMFQETLHGLICARCKTRPERYFIDFYHKGRLKIYSDKKGTPIDSYELAHRILEAIRYEVDQHHFDPSLYSKKDLREYQFEIRVKKWLDEKLSNPNLAASYTCKLKGFVDNFYVPFFKSLDVRDIRYHHIKGFLGSLPKSFKSKYMKNILDGLKNFVSELHADEYIPTLPNFPTVSFQSPDIKWIDEETQHAILNAIPNEHKDIFLFMFHEGLRPGEVRSLKKKDINLKENIVTIQRAFSGNVLREVTKTKRIRTIPLSPEVSEMLLLRAHTLLPEAFVFTWKGKPYVKDALYRIWIKACTAAKVEGVHLYGGTRHSFASQAVNRGISLWKVGKFLGHAKTQTTERYAHARVMDLTEVITRQDPPELTRKSL
jgi:integrase